MESLLTLKIPLSQTLCKRCANTVDSNAEKSNSTANILFDVDVPSGALKNEFFRVNVDVKKIKWTRSDSGNVIATAEMFVLCPSCDKLHWISSIIDAPKIYLQETRCCEVCGQKLTFQEDELQIEEVDGKPYVFLTGKMTCDTCQKSIKYKSDCSIDRKKSENVCSIIAYGNGTQQHF